MEQNKAIPKWRRVGSSKKTLPEAKAIWNDKSPLIQIILSRFEREGLHTWNNARVSALARALHKTIWLLAAEAGCVMPVYDQIHDVYRLKINHALIRSIWKSNRWPVWATLHFERFERYLKTNQLEPGACLLSVSDAVDSMILGGRRCDRKDLYG